MKHDAASTRFSTSPTTLCSRIAPGLLALIMLLGGNAATAKADNLLADPGFEVAGAGVLQEYKGTTWAINGAYPGYAEIIKNADQAHGGSCYLKLKADPVSKTQQDFMLVIDLTSYPALKNTKYTYKAWVRGTGQVSVGFELFDSNNTFIAPADDQFSKPTSLEGTATGAWQQISFDYVPNPSASTLQVNICVRGAVDVDDMSLQTNPLTDADAAATKSKPTSPPAK